MKCRRRVQKRAPWSPLSSGEEDQANEDSTFIKKGPWKAEEDEVLLKHVHKYGPRDWSSLLSKRLLRRSGKSCRLRWVNKLRPNLKSGCKFSAEEDRTVIELQSQIGNKWATIATYLPGRTDNDVKNFWSSRQKRLARLLLRSQSQKSNAKPDVPVPNFISSSLEASNHGSQMAESSSACSASVDPIKSHDHKESSFPELKPEFKLVSPKAEEELIRTFDLDFITCDALFHRNCDQQLGPFPLELPSEWNTFPDHQPGSVFDDLTSDILDQIEQHSGQ